MKQVIMLDKHDVKMLRAGVPLTVRVGTEMVDIMVAASNTRSPIPQEAGRRYRKAACPTCKKKHTLVGMQLHHQRAHGSYIARDKWKRLVEKAR